MSSFAQNGREVFYRHKKPFKGNGNNKKVTKLTNKDILCYCAKIVQRSHYYLIV